MLKRLWLVLSIGWAALILISGWNERVQWNQRMQWNEQWDQRVQDFTPPPLSSHQGPAPVDLSSYGTITAAPPLSSYQSPAIDEWLLAFAAALAPFAAMPITAWIWAGRKWPR